MLQIYLTIIKLQRVVMLFNNRSYLLANFKEKRWKSTGTTFMWSIVQFGKIFITFVRRKNLELEFINKVLASFLNKIIK